MGFRISHSCRQACAKMECMTFLTLAFVAFASESPCRRVKRLMRVFMNVLKGRDLQVFLFLPVHLCRQAEIAVKSRSHGNENAERRRTVNDLGADAGIHHGNGGSGIAVEERISG